MKYILLSLLACLGWAAHAQENPGWSVNPASFQHTMNIVGEIFIDSLPPAPAAYWLGIFSGGQCRGAGQAQKQDNGKWLCFLTAYSNATSGETCELRLYYHPEEVILTATNKVPFVANAVLGEAEAPFRIYVPLYNDRPPFLSGIPDMQVEEGQAFPATDLKKYLTEYDKDPLLWSINGAKSLSVQLDGSGRLSVQAPSPYFHGADTVIVSVRDAHTVKQFSASDTVVLRVLSKDSPVEWLPISGQSVQEGQSFAATLIKAVEHDGDAFVLQAEGSAGLVAELKGDTLLVTPKSPDWFGQESIVLLAKDVGTAQALESRISIPFMAAGIDDAPQLLPFPLLEIEEGEVAAAVDLRKYLKEVDGDQVRWAVSGGTQLQANLLNGYGLTVIKKNNTWFGIDSLLVEVKDVTAAGLRSQAYMQFQFGKATGLEDAIDWWKVYALPGALAWEVAMPRGMSLSAVLYNMHGMLVGERFFEGGQHWKGAIDTQGLPSGVYFLAIQGQRGRLIKKIVLP